MLEALGLWVTKEDLWFTALRCCHIYSAGGSMGFFSPKCPYLRHILQQQQLTQRLWYLGMCFFKGFPWSQLSWTWPRGEVPCVCVRWRGEGMNSSTRLCSPVDGDTANWVGGYLDAELFCILCPRFALANRRASSHTSLFKFKLFKMQESGPQSQ